MIPKQQLINSLQLLCAREGGHAAVADAIQSSAQTLWQIINGAKLPSGKPRGVEPNLQKRLVLCSDNLNKARSSEQAMR